MVILKLFQKHEKKEVQAIRIDKADENIKLVKQLNSKEQKFYLQAEWTARDTTQEIVWSKLVLQLYMKKNAQ